MARTGECQYCVVSSDVLPHMSAQNNITQFLRHIGIPWNDNIATVTAIQLLISPTLGMTMRAHHIHVSEIVPCGNVNMNSESNIVTEICCRFPESSEVMCWCTTTSRCSRMTLAANTTHCQAISLVTTAASKARAT